MKISNKILLAFLMITFAIPLFIFMSFRNKIEKGELTKSGRSDQQYNHTGALAAFKIVKIVGPGSTDVFSCHLIPADSSWYGYNKYSENDSIKVEQKGDTLLLTYIKTEANYMTHLSIDIHMPLVNNVVVQGATVFMDTVNAVRNPEILFDLTNNARLSLGTNGFKKTITVRRTGENGQVEDTTVTESASAMFNKLTVKALSSSVDLGINTIIKDLHLQLYGVSSISIHNDSQIDQLNGALSDSASVNANWKNVRRLAALTH